MQECFYFGVQRSAADDHLAELAAEGLNQLLANLRTNDFVQERHFEYPAYWRFLNLRHDHLLVNLLQDQRNREDDGRLDFRKSIQQNLRARRTTDQPCVAAGCQTRQKIKRATVRMCQRQERHEPCALMRDTALQAVTHVSCQTVQRHDHAFAETRRAGGIVDRTDLAVGALVEMHIFCPVAFRVFLFELRADCLIVDLLRVQSKRNGMPVVQAHRRFDLGNLIQVDTFPVDVADEKQLTLRVVDDVNRVVRTEILQNRHDDRSVRHSRQIHSDPVTVVLAHDGYLVVFLHAAFLEKDVQFLDVDSQLAVCQGHVCAVIGHSGLVPVLAERTLVHLDKIIFLIRHHNG